ncbi:MAG: hypothetical protein CXT78_06945 [Thaumarchaeota archaeon]|nr:MAG: hypothetical protein CXT78_06945 [Nitrososphaerota archaeon]
MYTLKHNLHYSKKNIFIFLAIIVIISLGLKLITVPFDSLSPNDTSGYVLRAISHFNGDFTELPRKSLGWSLFVYPFLGIENSENFMNLLNSIRGISIIISLITIYPMYLLARRFFDEKYSLVATFLFAVEPHLNHNAGLGLSEPLFILVTILSVYFVLTKNPKLFYVAFLLVGVLWWIKFNGIVMLPIVSLLFFLNLKRTPNLIPKFLLGFSIFFVIVSPMLLERYEMYGDPLYFSQSSTLYMGEQVTIVAENTKHVVYSASDYINDFGISQFVNKFIIGGLSNLIEQILKLSFPYIIFLFPIGMFFSLRPFDQNSKYIRSNWIVLLGTIAVFVTYFAVVQERRLIFHILPFLIIFSIIPIQRLIEYGLSTFSFTTKKKTISLFIILGIILILAFSFTLRYEITDKIEEQEKIVLGNYLLDNFEGKILDSGQALTGLPYAKFNEPHGDFKIYTIKDDFAGNYDSKIISISLYGKSLNDFFTVAKEYDLKYIAINKKSDVTGYYPFLIDVYDNEKDFPFLIPIVTPELLDFKKLQTKIYEIDYQQLNNE